MRGPVPFLATVLAVGCSGGDARQAAARPGNPPAARLALEQQIEATENAIEAKRRRLHVPGAAVVVVQDDRVILLRGFGLRDVEAGLPVTPRTLFSLGSCTKSFTAIAAVMSSEQGVLSLEDPPRKFLPYFALRDPEADSGATLRDLLSHRTGVEDDLPAGWFERYQTAEALIRAAMRSRPAGRFRERFNYNNYMYLAVGQALAVAHGMSFEGVMISRLLGPLGMRTSNLSIEEMTGGSDFAWGYTTEQTPRRIGMESLAYLRGIAPAGALNSNAEEMAHWLRLMLGRGILDSQRLISEAGFQALLSPAVRTAAGHYGLGLFIEEWHGHRLYSAPGGVLGFGSRCEFLPDRGFGWVVLTNVDDQALPKAIREIIYLNLLEAR